MIKTKVPRCLGGGGSSGGAVVFTEAGVAEGVGVTVGVGVSFGVGVFAGAGEGAGLTGGGLTGGVSTEVFSAGIENAAISPDSGSSGIGGFSSATIGELASSIFSVSSVLGVEVLIPITVSATMAETPTRTAVSNNACPTSGATPFFLLFLVFGFLTFGVLAF
jgi:hypothetical protein